MQLEARALEVLHGVGVAALKRLGELLAQPVAELGQAAIAQPVAQEAPTQVMAGRAKVARRALPAICLRQGGIAYFSAAAGKTWLCERITKPVPNTSSAYGWPAQRG